MPKRVRFSLLVERQRCLCREGEAPAEPKPSSPEASLSHWNPWQVVFSLPLALILCALLIFVIGAAIADDSPNVAKGEIAQEILKRLNDDEPNTVAQALRDLELTPSTGLIAIPRLIDLTSSQWLEVRRRSIERLGALGQDAAQALTHKSRSQHLSITLEATMRI